jgi:very-short-patch-repair endonuclease
MLQGRNILLPDDPEWHQPIVMGDTYKDPNAMPPKMASEHRIRQLDAERAVDSQALFPYYDPNFKYASTQYAMAPDAWVKMAQASGVSNMMTNPMWFSPLHTPQNWQIASRRREIYQWCRFFYENEPKVAAAIDFYSRFPMNGFKLECTSRKVLKFFEHHVVKRLKLNEKFKMIASEYFMLGDVFIHTDVECPVCEGRGVDPDSGEQCDHPGGSFKRLIVLNPDWIEVQQSVLADEPAVVLVPDEELKRIVFYKQPKVVYDRIPDYVKSLVLQNKPIPLSNRTVSHLRHMPVPYGTYGSSLIRRLFTTLAYKTKIMTANWIVAERLIIPVRVVKIGSDNRPATSADIADVQQQLAATANDPNLTIVTHHNFEYEWYGATGKILQVTQEMEYVGKEILDGFMLNQSLLNGEMSGYQSAQVGVETLIRRIESWRHTLAEWAEENIFKPIAEMQGFIDEEASAEVGEPVFLYPTIKWNDLQLKDKNQWYEKLMQLHDKQVISTQTLMEEMDLDYDQEVKRQRYEQIQMGPAGGMLGGAGAGAMGGMGGMGAGGMAGGAGGEMGGMAPGGMPGGDMGMGGGMPGGDMGMGGGMPMSPAAEGGKVMKKGKGGKGQEMDPEEMAAMSPMVKLTRIEQSMAGMLTDVMSNLGINAQQVIKAQFPIENPKGGKPFLLDFAIPPIKLAIECDGEIWHGQPEQQLDDQERDNLLAQRGWSVLRFDDKAIEESPQAVKQTVSSYTQTLMKGPQKHASSNGNGHRHNVYLFSVDEEGRLKNCHRDYGKYFGRLKSYLGQSFGQTPGDFSVTEYNKQASSRVFQQ